jgi:hypothetical protein
MHKAHVLAQGGPRLPTAAGSAAAESASTEASAKTAASSAAPAESTTAASSPEAAEPPPAAEAGTARAGMSENVAENSEDKEEDPDAEKDQREINVRLRIVVIVGSGRRGRLCVKRDAAILRDDGGDLSGELQDSRASVTTFQDRDHLAAEVTDLAVGQDRFEAVADGGEILMIVDGEKNHDAAIFSFVTDAPFFGEIGCVVGDGVAFSGVDCDDVELRVGFIVEFGSERGEFRDRVGSQGAGKIVHGALRLKLIDFFGERGRGGDVEEKKNQEEARSGARGGLTKADGPANV